MVVYLMTHSLPCFQKNELPGVAKNKPKTSNNLIITSFLCEKISELKLFFKSSQLTVISMAYTILYVEFLNWKFCYINSVNVFNRNILHKSSFGEN